MKRVLCLFLSLCLCAGLCIPAQATMPKTREESWSYFSMVRNDLIDEHYILSASESATVDMSDYFGKEYENFKAYYSYISRNTSWEISHTGNEDYYVYLFISSYSLGSNSNQNIYKLYHDGYLLNDGKLGDWTSSGESRVKILHSGESLSLSFDQIIARDAMNQILDTENHQFLYEIEICLESATETFSFTKFFMCDESETIHERAHAFSSPYAPTCSGAAIRRADVGQLSEITVPITCIGNTAQTISVAVPFYDGSGALTGMGFRTVAVTSSTHAVIMPVSGLSGSECMQVLILDENLKPLSPSARYDIP